MPIVLVGLAAVLIAILGMLLINGYEQFVRGTSNLVPDWHIPGFGSPRQWWNAAANALLTGLVGTFGMTLAPLAQFVQIPVRWLMKHITGWLTAGLAILNVLTYLRTALIPWVLNHAVTYATSLYHAALNYAAHLHAVAVGLINYVQAHLVALISAVESAVLAALVAARAELLALINYVQAHLVALLSAVQTALVAAIVAARAELLALIDYVQAHVIGYIDQLVHELAGELAYTKAWLIAYCDAKVAAVVNAAVQGEHVLLGRALAGIWPRVIASVDGAIDVAGEDFRDVVADLKAIPRAIEDNPAVAAAGAATAIDALVKLARDCVMPNCRNLSGVGRELQSLFGIVEGDLLIGLLAEAAHDPEAVARGALDVARPILDGAVSIVRDQVAA